MMGGNKDKKLFPARFLELYRLGYPLPLYFWSLGFFVLQPYMPVLLSMKI